MRNRLFLIFFLSLFVSAHTAQSQDSSADSSIKRIDISETVITATRSEQKSSHTPVPVTVISSKEIKSSGFVKLNDVLGEMNGAAVVDYFGKGLQLRGLDAAYTMILIDNEPVIGRISGTFDLSKIPVDNIERIEIVRGPVSALYGSEALAGVVNIITKKPEPGISAITKLSYGSNTTEGVSETLGFTAGKFSSQVFAEGFHTSGYDLDKASLYRSQGENTNGTLQGKASYLLNSKVLVSVNSRYYHEQVFNRDRFEENNALQDFNMSDRTNEFSVTPGVKIYMNNNSTLSVNNHFTLYDYHSQIKYSSNGTIYYNDLFQQRMFKPELIFDKKIKENFIFTAGGGYIGEKVSTTRYSDDKFQSTQFLFVQGQLTVLKKITLIAGARGDHSSVYKNHLSPKIAAQYAFSKKIRLIASWGTGFKAPDFRQLYLNFTNSAVGYSVFGSEELVQQVGLLEQSGQIQRTLVSEDQIGKLKPETSNAFDGIVEIMPTKKLTISLSAFRNDINDLIETKAVAQKTNGQYVYSYLNLNRVCTQGLLADIKFDITRNFSAGMGYQYLEAFDKQVTEDIKAGKIYGRDPQTLYSYKVKLSEYGGLFNRSRHSGNIKIYYQNERYNWNAALRFVYLGKYGYADKNGNQILDAPDEYVKGFGLLNLSVSKELFRKLSAQVSLTNLFDYTNPEYNPSLSGRTYLLTIYMNIHKNKNQNK